MALLEIPHLNKSAILPRLMIFPSCFLRNAIKRNDKVVEKISWHQEMKNGRKLQT